MRRWAAIFLLLVVATFLAGADHCDEGTNHHHRQHAQHILCPDDCAPALIPQAPTPPPPDPMPKVAYEETVARPILNLDLEPEKAPPRA